MRAVCVLRKRDGRRKGIVYFKSQGIYGTKITVEIEDLKPGLHGFHIHESGDLSGGCDTLCAHYNPHNRNHGSRKSKERHKGDLGNVKANAEGFVKTTFTVGQLRLRDIIGRSVVVHADRDDLGKGGNEESLKTGNAGKRVLCGVIGKVI